LDGNENAPQGGDQAIAYQRFLRQFRHAVDEVGVDLTQADKRPRLLAAGGAEPLQKRRSITFHGSAGIVFRESEVESVSSISARKSAQSCAESVNLPGNASEGLGMKNGKSRFYGSLDGH
jgi:hypothetical protein